MAAPRPRGAWAGKPWRDALRVAARRLAEDDAQGKTKLDRMAAALIQKGVDGDVPALKEIGDRLDGKVPQALVGGDDDDNPVRVITEIRRVVVDPKAST